MKAPLIAFATVGLVLTGSPALAKTVEVPYSDLNLTSPDGQKALSNRIEHAAREVCDIDGNISALRMSHSSKLNCYSNAIAAANRTAADITKSKVASS